MSLLAGQKRVDERLDLIERFEQPERAADDGIVFAEVDGRLGAELLLVGLGEIFLCGFDSFPRFVGSPVGGALLILVV
jgi:hypothetical protein